MSAAESHDNVALVAADGKKALIAKTTAVYSPVLREMIEETPEGAVEMPLAGVSVQTLQDVNEYMEHHHADSEPQEIERPLKAELKSIVDSWEWSFVQDNLLEGGGEAHIPNLLSVLAAANGLGLAALRDLCCAALADMLRGKTEEEILALFGVSEPFSREEEEALCRDYPWLQERGVVS